MATITPWRKDGHNDSVDVKCAHMHLPSFYYKLASIVDLIVRPDVALIS